MVRGEGTRTASTFGVFPDALPVSYPRSLYFTSLTSIPIFFARRTQSLEKQVHPRLQTMG